MIQQISVREYGGRIVEKILVEDLGEVVLVTTPEEWDLAQSEQRKPITVGFKKEYVLGEPVKNS